MWSCLQFVTLSLVLCAADNNDNHHKLNNSNSNNTDHPRSVVSFPVFRHSEDHLRLSKRLLQNGEDDGAEASEVFSRTVAVYGTHEKMGYFYATVNIGTPPQAFGVILDTGSSIMSVPCENCSHCGQHLDPVFNVSVSLFFLCVFLFFSGLNAICLRKCRATPNL